GGRDQIGGKPAARAHEATADLLAIDGPEDRSADQFRGSNAEEGSTPHREWVVTLRVSAPPRESVFPSTRCDLVRQELARGAAELRRTVELRKVTNPQAFFARFAQELARGGVEPRRQMKQKRLSWPAKAGHPGCTARTVVVLRTEVFKTTRRPRGTDEDSFARALAKRYRFAT